MSNKFDLDCLKIENVEKNIFKNLCVVNTESLVTLSSYLLKSDVSLVRNLMIFRCISEVAKELGAVEVGLDASELKASNKSTSLIEEVTDDQDKNTDSNSSSENTNQYELTNSYTTTRRVLLPAFLDLHNGEIHSLSDHHLRGL